MTAGVLSDLLILAVAAAAPAALALFLLRKGLGADGPRFWQALAAGILSLGALAVAMVWGATIFAESQIAACRAANDPSLPDCDSNGLWVAIAGAPALACLAIFILGAAGFYIARKVRRAG